MRNIPNKFYLALQKTSQRNITFSLNQSHKNPYYDIYHVNYDKDELIKTWYTILICIGVP